MPDDATNYLENAKQNGQLRQYHADLKRELFPQRHPFLNALAGFSANLLGESQPRTRTRQVRPKRRAVTRPAAHRIRGLSSIREFISRRLSNMESRIDAKIERETRMLEIKLEQRIISDVKRRMAVQAPQPTIIAAPRPIIKLPKIRMRPTAVKAPTRSDKISNITAKIDQLLHPALPTDLKLRYDSLGPSQIPEKMKIYQDFYQSIGENPAISAVVAALEKQRYEAMHPTQTKRAETQGERMTTKDQHVVYVPQEQMQNFEKSYGRKRSSFSDDLTESLLEKEREAEAMA